jgi:hypothetical protein
MSTGATDGEWSRKYQRGLRTDLSGIKEQLREPKRELGVLTAARWESDGAQQSQRARH